MTPALFNVLRQLWKVPAFKKHPPVSVTPALIDDSLVRAVEWLEPWYLAEDATTRATFERELTRELCPEHDLFGQQARMLARREDMDDVLFSLADGRVAEVHLTWIGHMERDRHWPRFAVFGSLDEWVQQSMMPTRQDWLAQG